MKKFIFTLFAICLLASKLSAQKAWATPDPINPNDSITIWVDIKKCDRQQLAGTSDPLYMWTWAPKEHPKGHPLHNGTWQASTDALQMRSAGNDHVKLAKISEDLAKAQAKVNSAEETWLTLVAEAE